MFQQDSAKSTRVKIDEDRNEIEEVLNSILPPKEWDEDGQVWRQYVSNIPATRLDVVNLQEQLDMGLQQCQVTKPQISSLFSYDK